MTPIKMRKVEPTYEDSSMEVGDFFFETNGEWEHIVFVTPKKLRLPIPISGPGTVWQFNGNRESPSLTPSIWNDKGGHYDWHGFITNGELVTA